MDKQVALKSINEMPKNFELDELFERLIIIEKIEQGQKDIENGHTFTHEEARMKLKKWLR